MKQFFKCDCASECTILEIDDFEEDKEWGILGLSFYIAPSKETLWDRIKLIIKVLKWGRAIQNDIIIKTEDFKRLKTFINDIKFAE